MSDLNRTDSRLVWLRSQIKETSRVRKQALIDQRYWKRAIADRKKELGL
jgi:hypothetical protein